MTWLKLIEAAGVFFGFTCVWLMRKQSVWCWPASIVNAMLLEITFINAKLYADVGLYVVFFVLSIYGWWQWTHPGEGKVELPVTRLPRRHVLPWLAAVAVGWGILGFLLDRFTDANAPWPNSAINVISLAAQYLIARKVLENWLFWIAADLIMIPTYAWMGLHFVTLQSVLYLILAILGYFEWRKSAASAASGSSSASSCPPTGGTRTSSSAPAAG